MDFFKKETIFFKECSIVSACVSAMTTGGLLYPLLFLRRNLQLHVDFKEQATASRIIRTTWSVAGARGFYAGCLPHLVQLCPQMMLGMALFEWTCEWLKE